MPTAPIETDALVIGAGPVGLFQVFQLGLLEHRAHVVDALPHAGGQCTELYGDKPIYDIPGMPVVTGQALVEQLLVQVRPFSPGWHLGETVHGLQRQGDRFEAITARGTRFLARTVFIAAGVGAFLPRKLRTEGLEHFEGSQVFHHYADWADHPQAREAQRIVIVGNSDAAIDAALRLAQPGGPAPQEIVLLHRRDDFRPSRAESLQALAAAREAGHVRFVPGQVAGIATTDGSLSALQVLGPDGQTTPLRCDALLVLQGLSPRLGPIAEWGLPLEHKQLVVDPATFATSEPGIYAIGDVNTYPGKKKLIVCGFHEATLAAHAAATYMRPGRPEHLEYTTSSTHLHRLLGVSPG